MHFLKKDSSILILIISWEEEVHRMFDRDSTGWFGKETSLESVQILATLEILCPHASLSFKLPYMLKKKNITY